MRRAALVALVGSILACGGLPDEQLLEELRAARAEALADPGPAPEGFAPDLVLHLSPALVQRLVEAGLDGHARLEGRLDAPGGIVLRPDLAVERATVVPARGCPACLAVDAKLAGKVRYSSGIAGEGEVPVTVDAVLDLRLDTRALPDGWRVSARPEQVRRLSVEVEGLPKALTGLAEEPLRDFAQDRLAEVEPIELVTLAAQDLPIRGLRVEPEGAGVRLAMLSEAVHPGTVPAEGAVEGDWTLVAAPESLVWIARREAFRAGPQTSFELVGVPERFALDGARFALDLRLWRATPPGWWRDYRATGTVTVDRGRIHLAADGAEERAASPGAGLADPLALLGSGYLTDAIARVLQQSVPASGATTVEGWQAEVEVQTVKGEPAGIVVSGTLALAPAGKRSKPAQ